MSMIAENTRVPPCFEEGTDTESLEREPEVILDAFTLKLDRLRLRARFCLPCKYLIILTVTSYGICFI